MDSLIPIVHATLGDAQAAVDVTVDMLQASITDFLVAASQLLERYAGDADKSSILEAFVEGCMNYCTGNLSWRSVDAMAQQGVQSD